MSKQLMEKHQVLLIYDNSAEDTSAKLLPLTKFKLSQLLKEINNSLTTNSIYEVYLEQLRDRNTSAIGLSKFTIYAEDLYTFQGNDKPTIGHCAGILLIDGEYFKGYDIKKFSNYTTLKGQMIDNIVVWAKFRGFTQGLLICPGDQDCLSHCPPNADCNNTPNNLNHPTIKSQHEKSLKALCVKRIEHQTNRASIKDFIYLISISYRLCRLIEPSIDEVFTSEEIV